MQLHSGNNKTHSQYHVYSILIFLLRHILNISPISLFRHHVPTVFLFLGVCWRLARQPSPTSPTSNGLELGKKKKKRPYSGGVAKKILVVVVLGLLLPRWLRRTDFPLLSLSLSRARLFEIYVPMKTVSIDSIINEWKFIRHLNYAHLIHHHNS